MDSLVGVISYADCTAWLYNKKKASLWCLHSTEQTGGVSG